jgi:hypothetical protein
MGRSTQIIKLNGLTYDYAKADVVLDSYGIVRRVQNMAKI